MNEKFYSLPKEKQNRIINAAMEVFADNEYKRASTDLIAVKAGISKGLLFYYFQNKKELYLYVYNYLIDVMKGLAADSSYLEISDFFALLEHFVRRKMIVLEENPYITEFSLRAFYSEKEEVSEALNNQNAEERDNLYGTYFSHIDKTKFKEEINPYKIYQMLVWMTDGYLHERRMNGKGWELNELMDEFNIWMDTMKNMVYKEEYRNGCD